MEDKQSAPASPPRRRGATGKWLTAIFAVAFVAAIVVSWTATAGDRDASHSTIHVPPNLGQMELVGQVTGDEARAQVAKLHGKGIDMVDGYIAEYGKGRSHVTVWVAEAASEQAAAGLLKQMADRIGQGSQAFRNMRSITIEGKPVYAVDGAGGQHFFYAAGKKVIWLAIQGADSTGIIKAAFKTF